MMSLPASREPPASVSVPPDKMEKVLNMKKLFYILLSVWFFASCEDSEIRTDYIITPYVQFEDKGGNSVPVPAQHVKAYGYYVDSTYWQVNSWNDAVDGILTRKSDGTQTKAPDFTAELDEHGRLTVGPLTRLEFMLLVCYTDPASVGGGEMYAYRNAKTLENLPYIYVDVIFKPWRMDKRKSEAKWMFVNDDPPQPEPEPAPAL